MTSNLQADLRSVIGKLKAKRQKIDGAIETLEQLLEGEPVGLVGEVKYGRHYEPPQVFKVGDLVHHTTLGAGRVTELSTVTGNPCIVTEVHRGGIWVDQCTCKRIVDGPAMLSWEEDANIPPQATAPVREVPEGRLGTSPLRQGTREQKEVRKAPESPAKSVEMTPCEKPEAKHAAVRRETPEGQVAPTPPAVSTEPPAEKPPKPRAIVAGINLPAQITAELLISEGYDVSVYTIRPAKGCRIAVNKLTKAGARCYTDHDVRLRIRAAADIRVSAGELGFVLDGDHLPMSPFDVAAKFPDNPLTSDLKESLRG